MENHEKMFNIGDDCPAYNEKPYSMPPSDPAVISRSSKRSIESEQKEKKSHIRYLVLAVSVLCLTTVMSNSLAFNFTVICIDPHRSTITNATLNPLNVKTDDLTSSEKEITHKGGFTSSENSWLFSAIAFGTIIGTIPITYFTITFGARYTFTVYGLISAFSTLLSPICTHLGFWPLFLMRLLQGVAVGISFPSIGAISSWATLQSNGMFIAIVTTHNQFGSMFTLGTAGILCESRWGWPSVYYIQGTICLFSFALFYLIFRDSPRMHRRVSSSELAKIEKGREDQIREQSEESKQGCKIIVPYRAIYTDRVIWGIASCFFGGSCAYYTFFMYGPFYLHKVLGVSIKNTGYSTALPYLGSLITKIIAGPLSDNMGSCVSEKSRVILFGTISQGTLALSIVGMALLPVENTIYAQICFALAISSSGLNVVGVYKCIQLVSRQFSGATMAQLAYVSNGVILALPLVVGYCAPNNTQAEWARIFLATATILAITTMVFVVTASAEPRPWARTKKECEALSISQAKFAQKLFSVPPLEKKKPMDEENGDSKQ